MSVILPTSRRTRSLALTLRTVLRQTLALDEFEVLVVENGPPSGSRRVARFASLRHPGANLRFLHEPTPGLLAGRHRGALEATGDLLVFADDDIDASPGWLRAIVDAFEDPEVQFVGGRNLPRYEVQAPAWVEKYWYTPPYGGRACVYLSLLDLGDEQRLIDATYVWGLNFAIRRRALFGLGGFHPDNPPDHLQQFQGDGETGLSRKANDAGLRVVYEPGALVHHRVPLERFTADYFRRRFFRQGVCDSFTALRAEADLLPAAAAAGSESREAASTMPPGELRHRRGNAWRGVLSRLRRRPRVLSASDASLTFEEIEPQTRAAYEAGYRIHQQVVRDNAALRGWVRRPDYWNYRYPEIGDCPFGRLRDAALSRAS